MTLKTIAIKNIVKRKGKMALIVFGLALAVATLVSVVTLVQAFQDGVDKQLSEVGYDIIISPRSKELAIEYGGMTLGTIDPRQAPALGPDDLRKANKAVSSSGRVREVSPKLLEALEVNGKRVLLAGVDLPAEKRVKDWWLVEAGRYPEKAGEVFIGEMVAEKLKVEAGDDLVVGDHSLHIAGILMETGSQDDSLIFMDLEELREITNKPGKVTLIEIATKSVEDVEPLASLLRADLPNAKVQSVRQAVSYNESALGYIARFGVGITAVVVLISALVVFTTMASAVNERRAEIGILRAIGFRQSKIAGIVLIEVLIVGLVAGVIGYALGFGAIRALPVISKDMVGVTQPSLLLFMAAVAMSVGIGLTASLVPARRAANLDPVESIKSL